MKTIKDITYGVGLVDSEHLLVRTVITYDDGKEHFTDRKMKITFSEFQKGMNTLQETHDFVKAFPMLSPQDIEHLQTGYVHSIGEA